MIHELKILPQYYVRVADGSKTFEIRDNDRGFQSGDTVQLREWNDKKINSTDNSEVGFTDSPILTFKIGYIYVLDKKTVIFSLLLGDTTKPVKAVKAKKRRKT